MKDWQIISLDDFLDFVKSDLSYEEIGKMYLTHRGTPWHAQGVMKCLQGLKRIGVIERYVIARYIKKKDEWESAMDKFINLYIEGLDYWEMGEPYEGWAAEQTRRMIGYLKIIGIIDCEMLRKSAENYVSRQRVKNTRTIILGRMLDGWEPNHE